MPKSYKLDAGGYSQDVDLNDEGSVVSRDLALKNGHTSVDFDLGGKGEKHETFDGKGEKPSEPQTSSEESKTDDSKDEKKRAATFGELFSFATCLDKLLMFLAFLMAAAHGASWPFLFLIFGDMTNTFISYGQNTTANGTNSSVPDPSDFEDTMNDIAIKYVYIGLAVCVATYVHMAFMQLVGERQTHKLRKAFFKSLLRQSISWYDKQQSGELTTRLADDLERVKEGIGDKVGLSVQFLAQFFAGFIMGFVQGWKLTLVIMSLTPLLAICASFLGKMMSSYTVREQQQYAKSGGIAEEVLSCIRTVISFNGQSKAVEKYSDALDASKKLGYRKSLVTGLGIGSTMLIMFCAYGLGFWFGSTQVSDYQESGGSDGLEPGSVFTVFFSVMVGSFALGSAAPHLTTVMTAKGAGGAVFSIIKDKPEIDSSNTEGKKPQSVHGYIQFRNVEFSYPTRKEAKILQGFNLDIEPGQTVALVGASGCGKSTIINLIQRFYDPDSGKVTLDGTDIKDLNIQSLRSCIGVVSQEPILFGQSIAKNIALGRLDVTMEEIQQAAKMANAHDFITELPEGYDTMVGERGAQLSGGQKQRVAIARALVRDPKILLLDEATSALDSQSEGIVQAALDKATQGRTTVVVAHRLSTIQNADVIYVMEDGVMVEKGKHNELMALGKAYYSLVTLQTIVEDKEMDREDGAVTSDVESNEKLHRSYSHQLSNGSTGQGHKVKSEPKSPSKKGNLFAPKVEAAVEEVDDVLKPGFIRMFKSNLKEWPFIVFGCIAAIINGAIFPVFAVFFSEVIKAFSLSGSELLDEGLFWSMMFVAMGGTSFLTNVIQSLAFGISGETLTMRLRKQTFQNILRQDVEFFDSSKHATGALTTRLATDASNVRNATGIRLAVIMQSITSMVAGLAIAFIFGWKLAFAIVGGIPIIMLAGAINTKLLKGNQMRDSKLLEAAGKTASECIENIKTVQSLTRESYFYQLYCQQLEKPYRENMKQAHIYGLSFAFSQGVIFFLYAGAFRFGAWLVVHDGMAPDLVFRVFFAITFTGMSVGQASSFLPEYSKAQLSAGHIFTMLDTVPKIDVYSPSGTTKACVSGEIQLKDAEFHYPSRPEVKVLKGVSIHVKPGQTAALVGMSGCGKSTIVSLIQRYYDPQSGAVLIEGVDLRDYNLKSVRSMMSVVSQEPVLFDYSIRDNIAYGLDRDVNMADVIAAAKTANAHDFITSLPDGYETTVGEKGTQLSGGQKQRVAIARALIRDPKILLLDEATSALDTESEQIVQAALDKARLGRTCIVIAHRLSTIQNADIIFAMENGMIVECGTHQELLAYKGVYYLLVQRQQFK